MPESQELQVAHSLLDDVQSKIPELEEQKFSHWRYQKAQALLSGDFARATAQIDKAASRGEDVSVERARVHFVEGLIYTEVATPEYIELGLLDPYRYAQMIPFFGRGIARSYWTKKYGTMAVDAFRKSTECVPENQSAYYNMGVILLELGDREAATDALKRAQTGDDREMSVEAAKALARM